MTGNNKTKLQKFGVYFFRNPMANLYCSISLKCSRSLDQLPELVLWRRLREWLLLLLPKISFKSPAKWNKNSKVEMWKRFMWDVNGVFQWMKTYKNSIRPVEISHQGQFLSALEELSWDSLVNTKREFSLDSFLNHHQVYKSKRAIKTNVCERKLTSE